VAAGAEGDCIQRLVVESGDELNVLLANLDEIPVHFEHADERLLTAADRMARRGETRRRDFDRMRCAGECRLCGGGDRDAPDGFVPFTIHGEAFEEAGATAVEEVGFTAGGRALIFCCTLQERGVKRSRAAAALEFSFAMGSQFFFQIAKLRAFRMLWARVVESFGGTRSGARARIAARTSRWNKTVYDPHVNILRATTEAMAAVLGGADSVTVAPFDACYKQPDEASRRLARNTQLLLKHEAWMGRVADAGGGSYFIEDAYGLSGARGLEAHAGDRGARRITGRRRRGADRAALGRSMAAREKAVAFAEARVGGNKSVRESCRAGAGPSEAAGMKAERGAQAYEEMRLRTERHAAAGGLTPRVLAGGVRRREDACGALELRGELFCLRRIRDGDAALQKAAEIARRKAT
jgi:hypothetical protein